MIKALALTLFGWKRTPERFVARCAEYVRIHVKERGVIPPDRLSSACCVALSQLAYLRAADMNPDQRPRFKIYVRHLESVSDLVALALAGNEIGDERVRSILLLHRVI